MPVTGFNSDIYTAQFSQNVALLSQQQESLLLPAVTRQDCQGEQAELVVQYGQTSFTELSDPTGATSFDSISKTGRWVFPTDYKNALPVVREDELQTITDPTNPLNMGQAAAMGRLFDDVILNASTGTAQTGKYNNLQATAFPAANNLGGSAVPFSLGLCKDIGERMTAASVPQTDRWAIISPAMARLLQDDPEFTSSDYNTSRALNGPLGTGLQGFLGFNWIVHPNIPDTLAGVSKSARFWHRSGMAFGLWASDGYSVFSRIDERPDLNYATQVYSKVMCGSSRTEEAKVWTIENNTDYPA